MKVKNIIIPILFIITAVLISTSCMTSKGSLLTDVADADSNASSEEEDSIASDEEEITGLTITTDPSDAAVYINDNYAGDSPVSELLSSGNYRITVRAEGYYSTTEWVNYSKGENVSLNINLEPITGFLNISISPGDAQISDGWDNLYEGTNELQIGNHIISAKLFGYELWEKRVVIHENTTTSIKIKLEPSVFNISNLFLSRQAFNPGNPAGLGECKISFDVSTYGSGDLIIFSEQGQQILTNIFSYFDKWDQSFVWNGKDNYGKLVPDGNYRVVIEGKDINGKNLSTKETYITIDSSLIISIRTSLSGTSGTLYCPSPETLPAGSFQMAVSTFGSIQESTYRFPFTASARFIPKANMEITGQAGIIILPETSESYYLSGSVKSVLVNTKNGDVSWYLKGAYQNNHETDSQTNFTGLSVGLPVSLSLLPVTLVFTPELIISPFRVTYEEINYNSGFYYWGYGRAAVIFDIGAAMLGISAAARITPYDLEINSNNPLSAGVELNYLIPGTGIFITGIVSTEFSSTDNFYVNAGGGIGLIN